MHALMLELLHSAATDSDIERIIIIAEAVPMVITRSDIMLATDFLYLSYTAVTLSHWRHQPWGTRSRPPAGVCICAISRRCFKNVPSYASSAMGHTFSPTPWSLYMCNFYTVSQKCPKLRVISHGAHVPPTPWSLYMCNF